MPIQRVCLPCQLKNLILPRLHLRRAQNKLAPGGVICGAFLLRQLLTQRGDLIEVLLLQAAHGGIAFFENPLFLAQLGLEQSKLRLKLGTHTLRISR